MYCVPIKGVMSSLASPEDWGKYRLFGAVGFGLMVRVLFFQMRSLVVCIHATRVCRVYDGRVCVESTIRTMD